MVWLTLLGAGCGWVTPAEADLWLARTTCDGGAHDSGAPGCVDFYEDRDADGVGGPLSRCLCAANEAWPTETPGDCDDGSAAVHPGAVEQCDELGVDEDCDPDTPNGDQLYYADSDDDGFGTAVAERHCAPGATFRAATAGDCDDTNDTIHPGAAEVCDGVDNDCDAGTSEDGLVTVGGGTTFRDDIQAAADDAEGGATLSVCAGVYGPVYVDHALTLVGLQGAENTFLDADFVGSALTVAAEDVTITGVTLQNGGGTTIGTDAVGGGVFVLPGASLTLNDCVVTGNRIVGHGAGIYASGPLTLSHTLIYDNSATGVGGGIHTDGTTLALLHSNVFYNQANVGAGLDVEAATVDLTDSRIAGNFGDFGGGMAVHGETVVTNGTLSSNSASLAGAGIYLDAPSGTLRLVGVTVEDNVSVTDGGGGVALAAGSLVSEGANWVDAEKNCSRSNYPNDVYTAAVRICASDNANFTCTVSGCTGDVYSNCDCIRR